MARRALNEMKWHPEKSLKGVEVTYLHRGAPGDLYTLSQDPRDKTGREGHLGEEGDIRRFPPVEEVLKDGPYKAPGGHGGGDEHPGGSRTTIQVFGGCVPISHQGGL